MDNRYHYLDLASCFLESAPQGLQNMPELLYKFAILGRRYTAPQRHYHNLEHIFFGYYKHRLFFGDMTPPLLFAWLYHDSIYNPQASDNEEQSAQVFRSDNQFIGLDPDAADEVIQLILSTKHTGEKNIITDVDLVGLGSSPENYDANSAAIRREYYMATDEQWKEGRCAFIQRFLAMDRIFFTPQFREAYEKAARENLQREFQALTQANEIPS
jgi:predicted metal-dependent HD superfamily phosphohydrolase